MKRTVFLIMVFLLLFCACAGKDRSVPDSGSGVPDNDTSTETAVSTGVATESAISGSVMAASVSSGKTATDSAVSSSTPAESAAPSGETGETGKSGSGINVTMAKKGGPMLPKRIDPDRKGTELSGPPRYSEFATGPVKGDDGNCYYYRRERKKGGRITFYRNSGIKVCETVLPQKYEKDYYISVFSKQGERFWIRLASPEFGTDVLVPVEIRDGKCGRGVKMDTADRFIYYKGRFYASSRHGDGMITVTDQKGNKKRVEIEEEDRWTTLQTVIDDKLYYITQKTESDICTVMRCDLDGSHREKLFRYNEACSSGSNYCRLTLDGDFFYLFDPGCGFMLTRVPLYGGKAEEIVETDWYQLAGDSIYYWDKKGISRVDKDLEGKPEPVIRLDRKRTGNRFFCADRHILAEIRDREEWEKLEAVWDMLEKTWDTGVYGRYYDISMNYSSEYYWISEKGKVEKKIPGSGFFRKYQEWYESAMEYQDAYGPDEDPFDYEYH